MSNRDLNMERALILEACKAYGFDGEDVAAFVQERLGLGDWRDFYDRDFGLEALEEAADAEAYGTGAIGQLALFPDSELRAEAMSEVAEWMRCASGMAYHARRYRALVKDIRNDARLAAA